MRLIERYLIQGISGRSIAPHLTKRWVEHPERAALPAIGGLLAAGQSGDADASIAALARRGLKVIKNGDDYDLIDEPLATMPVR